MWVRRRADADSDKWPAMAHEIAKLILEHADTFAERTEAIRTAMSLGMPLNEIQEYLDWLETIVGRDRKNTRNNNNNDEAQ